MKKKLLLLIFLLCCCKSFCQNPEDLKPFLSNLNASKTSPLYTTYAAAMERSEFILDEGYQFQFYLPGKGIDFITDNGGDLCLGFIVDDKWIYKEQDMFSPPIITTSYPDMVKYYYYPVKGVRVEAVFLVQSSRIALWDLNIINENDFEVSLKAVPFMRNNYRSYDNVKTKKISNAVVFEHQAYPDNWTVSHGLPYEDSIKNVLMISGDDHQKGVFNSLKGETPSIPFQVNLDKKSFYQISGRALKKNQERVTAPSPVSRIQVFLNNDRSKLITEKSPVFGLAQPAIDPQGYFRMELGNIGGIDVKDKYTFTFYNKEGNLSARYTDTVKEISGGKRRDVILEEYNLPAIPQEVRITKISEGYKITWEDAGSDLIYNIYRRQYPEGVYKRIATNLIQPSFTDSDIDEENTYGYVIISEKKGTGITGMHSEEVTNLEISSFDDFLVHNDAFQKPVIKDNAKIISFKKEVQLAPRENKKIRIARLVGEKNQDDEQLISKATAILDEDLEKYLVENEELFSQIPLIAFSDPDKEMLYWSSFNMMRQVFYPPEGKSSYNYYVFSREPTWGWGHGGQVFHESITMLAYAFMDPVSAMNSQRVYSERQYENGYINYRTGSYLDEIIKYNGQLTSSAPWYAWQNWEVYKITGDKAFLKEMYQSSKEFYNFYVSNRDSDNDGLCEWGGHAVLESVRDALVAVWDQVGWPANFEGVDLNSMLVSEAKALEAMARELDLDKEAAFWKNDHEKRAALVRKTFWDEEKAFYFNVDKADNDFTFENHHDLKREEIIGFLPLWAGIASKKQAKKLVEKLTDPDKFWRKYGIPSLAADDPYYNDKGYWNGPVWVEWNFLIMQGLLDYGYEKEAAELVDRVAEGMIAQLKNNHNLWEFYSPDEKWGGYHKTYIWAGIINRMMIDVRKNKNKLKQ